MRYCVRTPDGELEFATLADVARAYQLGLVGPDDEVVEAGQETGRRAATLPALVSARATERPASPRAQRLQVALLLGLAALALWLLFRDSAGLQLAGLALALLACSLLMRVTYRALSPRKTFG